MSAHSIFVATADDVIEQLMIQCWIHEARAGQREQAWRKAEATLERLLSAGLPHQGSGAHLRLDPYAANNALKSRATEIIDPAWHEWQRTTRRNATSLPAQPHRYRLTLQREWHDYSITNGRAVVLRMPLPLRSAQLGTATVKLLQPTGVPVDIRQAAGRVELRIEPQHLNGPIVVEMQVEFVSGDCLDPMTPAAPLGSEIATEDQLWLRNQEGLLTADSRIESVAKQLANELRGEQRNARDFAWAAWRWLLQTLRFGDVHRPELDSRDPLGGLLDSRVADCVLGSSLLIGLCRHVGIPARLLTGYLLHPANIGPHSWAEIRLAPGVWVPFDFGCWCYSAGNPDDPEFGNFFRGRSDARFVAEIAPREFTGWGSAPPPEHWYRLEKLPDTRIEHSLHRLPDNQLFRRDLLDVMILDPQSAT